MKLNQEAWERLYPWLDKAQDVSPADLPQWIARLVAEQPEVGMPLRELLAQGTLSDDDESLFGPVRVRTQRPSRTGQHVGAYTIDTLLAQGGMGEVWLAHRSDGQFEGKFAVKLLHLETPGPKALDRFKREGRVLAQLTHPNIARLIDAGAMPDGQPFLVLEYIDGEHVDRYCESRSLSTRSRVRLFLDVLAAVAHAHTSLIIHRDIKPSNVLVTTDGIVKLLDFGIAKLIDPDSTIEERGQLTRIEEVALTPSYAAPEQILGEPLSTATDVYQLGVLLHVLLAGCLPPGKDDATRSERIKTALEEIPVRMSDAVSGGRRKELRGDLDAIVGKSLRKRAAERYSTAAALSADLQRYLEHEPVGAQDGLFLYRAGKFVRRYRGAVISVTAILASLMVATAVSLTKEHKIRLERDRADQIAGFMTQIFKVPDPSEARGNTVTAREILDKSSQQIETGVGLDPGVQSDLLQVMAQTYANLGLYARAHSLAQSALDSRRRLLGPEDPKTLESLQQIGNILFLEGHSAQAEDSLRRTLQLQIEVLGPDHVHVLETKDTLVNILVSKGRFSEAETLGRQTVAVETRTLGPRNVLTLRTSRLLGSSLRRLSRFEEAETLLRQTASTQRAVLGADHPDTLQTQFTLANMFIEQGRHAEAEVIFRDVLAARRRILGDEHPVTADTMTTLAMDLAAEPSRYAEAEQLFRKALAIELQQVGPESRFTTRAEEGLANLIDSDHRYAEAESLHREVLRVRLKTLGPDNSDTLLAQSNLADVLNNEGHVEEAEQLYQNTLEQQMRVLDPDDVDLWNTKVNLAAVLLEEHRATDAEPLARGAYETFGRLLAPDHRFSLYALFAYARALAMQGRNDEANALYVAKIDKLAKLPNVDASGVWYDFARLAALAGHADDAFDHLERAVSFGYKDAVSMRADDDLKSLREDARFARLIQRMQSGPAVINK
jgi:eukaryotic-like serine/threonine-protein kinase